MASLAAFISPSAAQTYPGRAITVIVPYPPGGNTDVIARIVLEGMGQNRALDDPAVRKRLQDFGAIVPPPERRGPHALRDFVSAEIDKWTPVIKAAGVGLN